jgi:hypothetical protein
VSPILVLVNPQDIVNIASAVRIARNFGIEHMRLVDPEVFDPWRIEGIAHNTADFVARIEILPTLEAAIADCVSTFVLTGRERAAKRRTLRPKEAAGLVWIWRRVRWPPSRGGRTAAPPNAARSRRRRHDRDGSEPPLNLAQAVWSGVRDVEHSR